MASTTYHDAPQWITNDYVEKMLQNYLKDETLKVKNIDITPAIAKGESYSSVMTRVKTVYEVNNERNQRQMYFIAKTTFENNAFLSNLMQKYDVYNTEMQMYEKVCPQFQQLLREIGDEEQLCAKTIQVDHANKGIIFEDLSERNFVMPNRLEGMNERHIKIILKKLAKWHAAAAVLNERQPGCLEKFCHGILNRHYNGLGPIFENVLQACAKFCESCEELGKYYKDKLMALKPFIVEYATKCYDLDSKHFLTLNHGDLWTNNVMAKYGADGVDGTKENIKDILLIDFQYCNWSSPAVDLHYFLYTSLHDDLLLNHQLKFIQFYYGILRDTLEKLNYSQHIPTLHEFHIQLKERAFLSACAIMVCLPIMINDKSEDADFESLLGDDEKCQKFHNILYTNPRLQRIVKHMLPKLDCLGLLDVVR